MFSLNFMFVWPMDSLSERIWCFLILLIECVGLSVQLAFFSGLFRFSFLFTVSGCSLVYFLFTWIYLLSGAFIHVLSIYLTKRRKGKKGGKLINCTLNCDNQDSYLTKVQWNSGMERQYLKHKLMKF